MFTQTEEKKEPEVAAKVQSQLRL